MLKDSDSISIVHQFDGNSLADEDDCAAEVMVSSRTLQGWRQRGEGPPFIKVGRLVRYRRADIQAWLREQTRQSTSQSTEAA